MRVSGMLIVMFAIILAIWDGIAMLRWGLEATESYWIATTAAKHPSFTLAAGILIGHFFCAMTQLNS